MAVSERMIRRAFQDGVPDCTLLLVDQVEALYRENTKLRMVLGRVSRILREGRNKTGLLGLKQDIDDVLRPYEPKLRRGRVAPQPLPGPVSEHRTASR